MTLSIFYFFDLAGEDTFLHPDQSRPSLPLVHQLLLAASGAPATSSSPGMITLSDGTRLDLSRTLTTKDLSRVSSKRRVEARKTNPQFSMSVSHKLFGSSK